MDESEEIVTWWKHRKHSTRESSSHILWTRENWATQSEKFWSHKKLLELCTGPKSASHPHIIFEKFHNLFLLKSKMVECGKTFATCHFSLAELFFTKLTLYIILIRIERLLYRLQKPRMELSNDQINIFPSYQTLEKLFYQYLIIQEPVSLYFE